NFEGRDLCDDEAYRHLLEKYELPIEEFYGRMKAEEYHDKATYDFSLCQQLKVSGFPTMFMQVTDTKLYQLSRGYLDFDSLHSTIEKIRAETASTHIKTNLP
ncbi:MAG TPA: hypothetical protein VLC28_15765, partial [Flavitalea sp.]|nr:hypothetical protein [Flavitalea sp.]